jgi:hypothetical protein
MPRKRGVQMPVQNLWASGRNGKGERLECPAELRPPLAQTDLNRISTIVKEAVLGVRFRRDDGTIGDITGFPIEGAADNYRG